LFIISVESGFAPHGKLPESNASELELRDSFAKSLKTTSYSRPLSLDE
jgi:hypothetical protein